MRCIAFHLRARALMNQFVTCSGLIPPSAARSAFCASLGYGFVRIDMLLRNHSVSTSVARCGSFSGRDYKRAVSGRAGAAEGTSEGA